MKTPRQRLINKGNRHKPLPPIKLREIIELLYSTPERSTEESPKEPAVVPNESDSPSGH